MSNTSFDLCPHLSGPTILLRPLIQEDFEALAAAASDPLIWEQHPDKMRFKREVFEKNFFLPALKTGALVAVEHSSNGVIGSSRFYDWNAERREVFIGYTFLVRRLWGGATNGEMKQLMLEHAFKSASRVLFHIGADNWRSRKALEKIGGTFSHDEQKEEKGEIKRTAVYQLDAPTPPPIF